MKSLLLVCFSLVLLSSSAFAQFGNLLNNIKSSPLLTQQQSLRDIMAKVESLSAAFSQLPLNSGKLEFIKAALPLLSQVKDLSGNSLQTVDAGKPVDPAQTSKMSGLLDQVKGLISQKLSSNPLTPGELPDAANQVSQFTSMITGIMQNEGDSLKKLAGLSK